VSTTTPSNGATNVALNAAPSVTFSKAVNVTASAFTLECPSGTPEAFTLTPAPPGGATTFTLTPSTPLPAGTVCTVTAVASQVKDLAGTNLAADYVLTFTTAAAPIAHDYTVSTTAVGNTLFVVGSGTGAPGGPSVTDSSTNDNAFAHVTNPGVGCPDWPATLSLPGGRSTANGGTVQIVASGANEGNFYYEPPVGFTGTDTFRYTATDSCGSSTATVSIPVQNKVWYVNDNNASNGNGTSTSPFNVLSSVSGTGAGNPSGSGDYIFLYGSSTAYSGGITLKGSQTLVSQSFGLSVNGHALVGASGANPTITNSGGAGVTIAAGDTIEGITVANTSGNGVAAANVNAFTLDPTDVIQNTTGNAIDINGGNGTIANGAAITTSSSGGHSISIQNRTGGTITNSGNITDSGKGILLSSNAGAEIDFTGKIIANTGANTALFATGGGTVTATGAGSTLTTTTATALNVANTTIGPTDLTFQSITAGTTTGSAGDGIVLDTTGSSGGLTVTGSGTTAGSGGTVQHLTGTNGSTTSGVGIYLNNTADVSLTDMQLNDLGNYAIFGTGVSNFTFASGTINGTNGASTPLAGASLAMDNLTGAATISNSTVVGGYHDDVRIANTSGTLKPLTVSGDAFAETNSDGNGNDAMLITAGGTGTELDPTITGSHFTAAQADLLNIQSNDGATVTLTMNAASPNNTTFSNNNAHEVTNNQDLLLTAGSANNNSTLNFDVENNTFSGSLGNDVAIGTASGSGTNDITGKFDNNAVGVSGAANFGSAQGSDLSIGTATGGPAHGTITVEANNNKLYQYNNDGIQLATDSTTAAFPTLNATTKNDTIAQPNTTNALNGVDVEAGASTGSQSTICLNALGNTLTGSGVSANGGFDLFLSENMSDTIDLQGYTGTANNTSQIASFESGQNTVDTGTVGVGVSTGAGAIQGAPSACPTPS
jgi:large repetitive protein